MGIRADLTQREIWIVAIKENIDTSDGRYGRYGRYGAKFYRRMMLAQGASWADAISERIRVGLGRARAEGKKLGRPPAQDQERILEAQRIYAESPSISRTARIMNVSQGTVKKALGLE